MFTTYLEALNSLRSTLCVYNVEDETIEDIVEEELNVIETGLKNAAELAFLVETIRHGFCLTQISPRTKEENELINKYGFKLNKKDKENEDLLQATKLIGKETYYCMNVFKDEYEIIKEKVIGVGFINIDGKPKIDIYLVHKNYQDLIRRTAAYNYEPENYYVEKFKIQTRDEAINQMAEELRKRCEIEQNKLHQEVEEKISKLIENLKKREQNKNENK